MQTFGAEFAEDLSGVTPPLWDALAHGQACLTHAYLSAMERSGSVGAGTGWQAHHLLLRDGDKLAAAMPLYRKQHSYGEYVFDWAWADAYARNGLSYYPKLLAAIPFTPIPGPRLMARDDHARDALLDVLLGHAEESGLSSLHVLFPTERDAGALSERGMLIRHGVQFHWLNRGYADFSDFLAHLNNDKRKKIRQERRRADELGLSYRWLDGELASPADWAFFYRCYAGTYAQHRSTPYLAPDFFHLLAATAPRNVRLLIASRGARPVASAFFLCDETALYGRYWGAVERLPFLHFELCYYQAIAYAIATARQRFEGGAQGEHKLARGLEPIITRSAHWIRDPRFRDAVDRYLARETEGVGLYLDELNERTPFRTGP